MDAFEQVVAEILWREGYWVRTSFKVELTREDKLRIGRPSSPRWELDIVAYRGKDNLLQVVECKSYLDSIGVQKSGFDGTDPKTARLYKLFTDDVLRDVVFQRLREQLTKNGACQPNPEVKLCLACGKIKGGCQEWLGHHFRERGWGLWDVNYLRNRLEEMAGGGYENQVSAVVAKLLVRGRIEN